MDWQLVKSLVIPEGNVKKITDSLGNVLWELFPYDYITAVHFDGTGMFELPFNIEGSDTIKTKLQLTSTSGNMFGYYESSASEINFCLYASSSSYIRYDGGLYRNWDFRTGIHEVVFGPTGLTDNGSSKASWSAKTFTGGHPMVGGLPNSTTVKAQWDCYNFEIVGKCKLLPVKRKADNVVGLYDTLNDIFYTGNYMSEV